MRLGQPPVNSHDWKMGNSASRAIEKSIFRPSKNDRQNNPRLTIKGSSYTKEEILFVKNNYLKYSDLEFAKILGRTLNGISGLRSRNGFNRERKAPFKVTLRNALREAQLMREVWHLTQDMKALIIICQLNISQFKKEQYKKQLLKLSNFDLNKIKHKCN